MKTSLYNKMCWDRWGYNIHISVNISRWLIGFGSVPEEKYGHINIGPLAIYFYKQGG